jgi:predicted naringenin-chalcone synthase
VLRETLAQAFIHRIATAVPDNEVHDVFIAFAGNMLEDERRRAIFHRMAAKSGIDRRYSVLRVDSPAIQSEIQSQSQDGVDAHRFYQLGQFPPTRKRMQVFEDYAPRLLRDALDRLALTEAERLRIRHVIVTCCTGHYAPGLDFAILDHLGLQPDVSRTMIGFMGCYAAINGLKQAHHFVRSEPEGSVLLVNLELCSLHLQQSQELDEVLSFLLFSDGCSASLISSEPAGLAIDSFRTEMIPETRDLITWRIGDAGFLMHLSGQVPNEIEKWLRHDAAFAAGPGAKDLWAIHPGGRSVLDAVEGALRLPPSALAASRKVLGDFGNMSSATVMFVLAELMPEAKEGQRGIAMAFGPGVTAEMMEFHAV